MLNINYRDTLNEYFNDDGSPKKCSNCGSSDLQIIGKESCDEEDRGYWLVCNVCDTTMGECTDRVYNPEYAKDYLNFGRNV